MNADLMTLLTQVNTLTLTEAEWRQVNSAVIQRIRDEQTKACRVAALTFAVGTQVQFTHKGQVMKGKVSKLNEKTVEVIVPTPLCPGSETLVPVKWKVGPTLLTKVEG